MKIGVLSVLAILLVVAACAPQVAQQQSAPAAAQPTAIMADVVEPIVVPAGSREWKPAPASLPPGAQIMPLEGNLSKAEPFTFRLKVPAGYVIAPHTHPAVEHVTVLSGALRFGAGETIDEDATVLAAGSFAAFPSGHAMYAIALEDSVFQVYGVGPWGITYVNAADDPRKK
mgnify:CR=1 FL=1